jgi:hypothetical protein
MTFDVNAFKQQANNEGVGFTAAQEQLATGAEQKSAAQVSLVDVTTQMYVVNRYERMVDRLIQSSEKLAESNERHAKSLARATWALTLATFVMAVATVAMVYATSW